MLVMSSRKDRRNKKKALEKLPEYPIKIQYSCHTEITREATEDEWDADDSRHTYSFEGTFSLSDNNLSFDFILNTPPEMDKDYYLVYVTYSTGDTFHHEEGCMCMVEFLDNCEDAVALRNALKKDYDAYDSNEYSPRAYSFEMTLPKSGREIHVSTGTWKGYFESMDSINIQSMRLK
jgi:hypothetical protein